MNVLERAFTKMGARVEFAEWNRRSTMAGRITSDDLARDVRRDKREEYFLLSRSRTSATEMVVLDVQPSDRHLLLLSRHVLLAHRLMSRQLVGKKRLLTLREMLRQVRVEALTPFSGRGRVGWQVARDRCRRW